MNLHDGMIWRADTDKAHRCPCRMTPEGPGECPRGYVSSEETDGHWRRLHVYRCGTCDIRVTVFPGWPHYPGTDSYRQRLSWFWGRGLRYKTENLARHFGYRFGQYWHGGLVSTSEDAHFPQGPLRLGWRDRLHVPKTWLLRWQIVRGVEGGEVLYEAYATRKLAEYWMTEGGEVDATVR